MSSTTPNPSPASAATPSSGPREFPVDATLRLSWQLFKVSFVACLPLALLAICAGGAPQAFALTTRHSLDLGWWLVYAASALLMLLAYGAIILRQHGLLVGSRGGGVRTTVQCLRRSAAALPGTLFLLLALPLALPGLVLLVVPGLAVGIALLLAWPALLVQRGGPVQSLLLASRWLRGRFWRLLGLFSLAAAGVLVFVILAGVFAGVVMLAAQAGAVSSEPHALQLGTLVLSLVMVPPVLYLCATLVATYVRLAATGVPAEPVAADHQHR